MEGKEHSGEWYSGWARRETAPPTRVSVRLHFVASGPQHGLEVRVELCRFESRQPSLMHHFVTADASPAVELVLHA
jgi:hypothetical protein